MSEVTCSPLRGPLTEKLDKIFNKKNAFLEVNPGNVIMPRLYKDICYEILDSNVRKDDVWLISFPRTGKHLLHILLCKVSVIIGV